MALQTSAESPVPVRTVLRLVGDWVGKLGRVWVEGQITQANRRGNTVFITLRDPVADVSARVVCPRETYDAVTPAPTEGARVVIWAKPDFHVNRGSFALTALDIRPVGLGELLARLERLRRMLAAEGLFAPERKRRLPFLPAMIGLVCGRDSAAERDVLENGRRRWPAVRFQVAEVAVQGSQAATEVMDAVRRLDADPHIEVIIISRGGGSVEDLLPFSDEGLVRAVAACRTPVVSAIGHEQDSPLVDLVADVRASTPTDAAKTVVPDVGEELTRVAGLRDRARLCLAGRLEREASWVADVRSRPALANPVREVERHEERVRTLRDRGRRRVEAVLESHDAELAHTRARLETLSPAGTLRRGYAIVTRGDGHVVRRPEEVADGQELHVRLADGQLTAAATGRSSSASDRDAR